MGIGLAGRATTDGRTGTVITYNHLNLPVTFTRTGLSLTYSYDALGNKLRRLNGTTSTTTDYIAGIQYQNGQIDFIRLPFGMVKDTLGSYRYYYDLTDHLGNVRARIREHPTIADSLQVIQRDNYYPFGMAQFAGTKFNPYLYNGKELQGELGTYDYGWRQYDPVIGRWNVVDPLVDSYYSWSPYNYTLGNPIKFIDPNGMLALPPDDYTVNEEGKIVKVRETLDHFDKLIKVDEKGNKTNIALTINKGILKESPKNRKGGNLNDYSIMQTTDPIQATNLFEFLANNTSVEWGKIDMTAGGIISTSHVMASERSSGTIMLSLMKRGMFMNSNNFIQSMGVVRGHVHSHPNAVQLGASGNYGKGGGAIYDQAFAEMIEAINSNIPLKIYHIRSGGTYFRYDSKRSIIK